MAAQPRVPHFDRCGRFVGLDGSKGLVDLTLLLKFGTVNNR
jgi:hypothetical protein